MADIWLSIRALALRAEVPETSARRYVEHFQDHFRAKKSGRAILYRSDGIEILARAAALYDEKLVRGEVAERLAIEFGRDATVINDQVPAVNDPAGDVAKLVENMKAIIEAQEGELAKQRAAIESQRAAHENLHDRVKDLEMHFACSTTEDSVAARIWRALVKPRMVGK